MFTFHDSFWRKQTLAATKLVLSLTGIDFEVAVSSRAVHISSRAVRVLRPYRFDVNGPHTEPFPLWFSKEIARGRYGPYDNNLLLTERKGRTGNIGPMPWQYVPSAARSVQKRPRANISQNGSS